MSKIEETQNQPMTEANFTDLLDRYGYIITQWPAEYQANAQAFSKTVVGHYHMNTAINLDSLLQDAKNQSAPSANLINDLYAISDASNQISQTPVLTLNNANRPDSLLTKMSKILDDLGASLNPKIYAAQALSMIVALMIGVYSAQPVNLVSEQATDQSADFDISENLFSALEQEYDGQDLDQLRIPLPPAIDEGK